MGPLTVLALFCSNPACRKVLALQVMEVQAPKIVAPDAWRN
ncbi:MAG: hypothetical protein ABH877_03390 [bacterium]